MLKASYTAFREEVGSELTLVREKPMPVDSALK